MLLLQPLVAAMALLVCGASAVPTALSQPSLESLQSLSPLQRRQLIDHLVELRVAQLDRRESPTGSYAPANVACPATTSDQRLGFIRDASAQTLSSSESDYVRRHQQGRQQDWTTWLTNSAKLDIPGGVSAFTSNVSNLPNLGFALSGGGLRAMTVGVGVLNAFDGRNDTANQRGTGGLLQLASYVAGLSGGSWATASLAMNDWPTAQTLNDDVWNLDSNLVIPEDGKLAFYTTIVADVKKKRDLGYATSITDYFGLSVADKVVNSTYDDKAAATWGDIRNTTRYQDASYPYPIILAAEREPGELVISANASIWEFTPESYGTWNPNVAGGAFAPVSIMGSSLDNGNSSLPAGQCVGGYDTTAFLVGTSATLFSGLYLELLQGQTTSLVATIVKEIAAAVSEQNNDISSIPNPFYNYKSDSNDVSKFRNISLVDMGLTGLNLPLWPLLQPARDLDVIFSVDSSADVTDWPNATALYETSKRAQADLYKGVPFPVMPDANTVINRGLNTRPVFYGCNADVNVTNSDTAYKGSKTPLIVSLSNYPWVYQANISTYQLQYSAEESQGVLDNSMALATLGGDDDSWATCLACAIMQRSFERSGTTRPSACDSCMQKWCWDGVTNTTTPSFSYSPATGVPEFITSNGTLQRSPASTGGNGSNSEAQDGNNNQSENVTASSAVSLSASGILGWLATFLGVGVLLL